MALELVFVADPDTVPSDTKWMVFAAGPSSPARTQPRNHYKLIYTSSESETWGGLDLSAFYTDVYGEPTIGQKLWFKIQPYHNVTGQSIAPTYCTAIYT